MTAKKRRRKQAAKVRKSLARDGISVSEMKNADLESGSDAPRGGRAEQEEDTPSSTTGGEGQVAEPDTAGRATGTEE